MKSQWRNGLLIKGDRICIPPELYERMLHDLHEGHKGIEKMQHLTHNRIYWQGMDADITEYVKNCKICTKHKATQAVQPMIPRDIPEGPWQDSQQTSSITTTQITSSLQTHFVSTPSYTKSLQKQQNQ